MKNCEQPTTPMESTCQTNKIKLSIPADNIFHPKVGIKRSRENIKRKIKDKISVVEDLENMVEGSCPSCEQKVENYDQLDRHLFLNHNLGVLCQEVSSQ